MNIQWKLTRCCCFCALPHSGTVCITDTLVLMFKLLCCRDLTHHFCCFNLGIKNSVIFHKWQSVNGWKLTFLLHSWCLSCQGSARVIVSSLHILEIEVELYIEENSLMWKLNTQLVKADHMTTFQPLMYGVCPDWLLCRMEDRPQFASSECMRLPHTQTHSVVISVLADLLMLTCSACLLGSWCCILGLSLSLPHLCLIHSSYFFSPSFYLSVIWWVMLERWHNIFTLTLYFMSHVSLNACGYPRCMDLFVCTSAYTHISIISFLSLPSTEGLIYS